MKSGNLFNKNLVVIATGKVSKIYDGIITIENNLNSIGSVARVKTTLVLVITVFENKTADAVILGSEVGLIVGMPVFKYTKYPVVNLTKLSKLFGSVINIFGTQISRLVKSKFSDNGSGSLNKRLPINKKALGITSRKSINLPVLTGTLAIDSLIPIGRGQRELIIGDRQTGKTTLCCDIILNNHSRQFKNIPVPFQTNTEKNRVLSNLYIDFSVYISIGQKQSTVITLLNKLLKNSAMSNVTCVLTTASDSAAVQYLSPYAGTTIAEYFSLKGLHGLVIYDDLTKHAVAYRQLTLLLRYPPGREAYPGDVFYLHSRLLERAAFFINGGSLTAIPIIETQISDISAYIPTNVISITDGQIFLDTELFYKGLRPAVNIGLSVSRVGSSAQLPAIKYLTSSLKLDLAQFREVESFSSFGSDLDLTTQILLTRGSSLVSILVQTENIPLNIFQEIALLVAGIEGFFDNVLSDKIENCKTIILNAFSKNPWFEFNGVSEVYALYMCLFVMSESSKLYINVSIQTFDYFLAFVKLAVQDLVYFGKNIG